MEQMRVFASNIKKLQQERFGSPSYAWIGECGALQRLLPMTLFDTLELSIDNVPIEQVSSVKSLGIYVIYGTDFHECRVIKNFDREDV